MLPLPAVQSCNYCGSLQASLLCRLAAIALLVLEDEESAFWCLVAIVETILPAEYYSKTLTASQVSRLRLRWDRTWQSFQAVPQRSSFRPADPGSPPLLHRGL